MHQAGGISKGSQIYLKLNSNTNQIMQIIYQEKLTTNAEKSNTKKTGLSCYICHKKKIAEIFLQESNWKNTC